MPGERRLLGEEREVKLNCVLLSICLFGLIGCGHAPMKDARPVAVIAVDLPEHAPVTPLLVGRIDFAPITEASGMVKSRLWPGVFWVHNDSGDQPRIFPITRNGTIIQPEWMRNYAGILIPDAVNVDWEDITTDNNGNLIIADLGNNANMRRDLCIYIINEPYPAETVLTSVFRRIDVYYPDQINFPPEERNFDSEAIFWANDHIYVLTKHRSDTHTKLYRLDSPEPNAKNPLTLLSAFRINSMVTSADATVDGSALAVLTYEAVWYFEAPAGSDDYFKGSIRWLPIEAGKNEGICIDGDKLLIVNEDRDILEVASDQMIVIRE